MDRNPLYYHCNCSFIDASIKNNLLAALCFLSPPQQITNRRFADHGINIRTFVTASSLSNSDEPNGRRKQEGKQPSKITTKEGLTLNYGPMSYVKHTM